MWLTYMVDVATIHNIYYIYKQLGCPESLLIRSSLALLLDILAAKVSIRTLKKSRGRLISAMNSTNSWSPEYAKTPDRRPLIEPTRFSAGSPA